VQENFQRFRSRYIILDIVIITIFYGIATNIIASAAKISEANLIKDPIVFYTFNSIFTILICFAVFRRFKKPNIKLKHLIGNTSFTDLPWLMLLIIFYGIYTLSNGVATLTIYFTHLISPKFAKLAVEQIQSNFAYSYNTDSLALKLLFFVVLFISIAIIPPLTEEFLFRGVLLHRFQAKWGTTIAVLLSSFLFGLVHGNIHSVAIGVSFIFVTLLYVKTKTLLVPISFHIMNNTIAVVSGIISNYLPQPQLNIGIDDLWSGMLNIAFATPILLYFFKWPNASELLPYTANLEQKYLNQLEADRIHN
jgi:uncharacterized protein